LLINHSRHGERREGKEEESFLFLSTAVFKLMRYTTEERKLEIKPFLLLTPDS
jgi:hypothetical protein